MKHFIVASDNARKIVVEWDTDTGFLEILIPGEHPVRMVGGKISHGIAGEDIVHFFGKSFSVTQVMHQYFLGEFPAMDIDAEYRNADAWCVRKKRKVKNAQAFMNNWLKRAKGGKRGRGGVQY
jgi:hypothetical protein